MEIKIRTWKIEDAPDLMRILNNKNVQNSLHDAISYPYDIEEAKTLINFILNAEKDSIYAWAITNDDKIVGYVDISRRNNIHYLTAEMGFFVSEDVWGNGIASKGVKAASEFVMNNTNILRIFSEPFSINVASCKVLENAGFVLEGILRKNAIKNGKIVDMSLYALVK